VSLATIKRELLELDATFVDHKCNVIDATRSLLYLVVNLTEELAEQTPKRRRKQRRPKKTK
jgi:hypothetical protein